MHDSGFQSEFSLPTACRWKLSAASSWDCSALNSVGFHSRRVPELESREQPRLLRDFLPCILKEGEQRGGETSVCAPTDI